MIRERGREREREFAYVEEPSGVGIANGICFSPKFFTLYSLITRTWLHVTLAPNWSWPTPTQRLPFTGHGFYPMQRLFPESFCWFYLRPDISVNNVRRVHHWSRWYITYGPLMLNWILWNRTVLCMKMNLALINLHWLICYKTNQSTNKLFVYTSYIFDLYV